MKRNITLKIFSAVMALSITFGALGFTVNAAASSDVQTVAEEKPDFSYVALGASNVAGYGLHGYNFDEIYEYPVDRSNDRRGYKMNPEGSYPVLLWEELNKSYNTSLDVIAASSMRAEEVHMLLDDTYSGDSYTDMWFFSDNGNGYSPICWGYNAGVYEYRIFAEAGVPGYNTDPDYEPTQKEALTALRKATQESVKNADLITVDAGMNNFGTYMLNLLRSGQMFDSNLELVSPELNKYYDDMRDYVIGIFVKVMGEVQMENSFMKGFIDTLAYAAVGYCLNTDAIMEHIFELNPDAEVVLVGAQSMMHGLEVILPGIDVPIPFGEIYDLLVNGCNLYSAVLSPYADKYYFANVSEDGHVEFLRDEIASYNGDPDTIGVHIKECFDVLDGTLYLKTRIQQMFAIQMSEIGFVNMTDAQKDMTDIMPFYNGFHYDRYQDDDYPQITVLEGNITLKEFLKKGEAGQLGGDAKTYYEMYERILNVAYDVVMEMFREGARYNMMNLAVILDPAVSGSVDTANVLLGLFAEAMTKAVADENYSFDMNELYPDGYFTAFEQENGLPEGVLCTMFSYSMLLDFASSAFSHPNYEGHVEVYDAVLEAYTQKIKGKDVIEDQIGIHYMPTEDSYYLAVSSGSAGYAELFGSSIGLTEDQVGYTTWDSLDYDKIDKADLVSIGFSEDEMMGFAVDQVFAYIANYIDGKGDFKNGGVRGTLASYVSSLISKYPILKAFESQALGMVNSTVDEILAMEYFTDKTVEEMDWAGLLGEDILPTVEMARTELKNAVIGVLGDEYLTVEVDVVEIIAGATNFNPLALYGILGDSSYLYLDVPVADGVVFALESYLYSYMEYAVKSTELISYINENNPDAKIVIFGHFNPIKSTYLELGGNSIAAGEMAGLLALTSSGRSLLQFSMSENSTFVYIFDAVSKFDASVMAGETSGDLFNFLSLYMEDRSLLDVSDESAEYIVSQMLYYITIDCDHKYDSICGTVCNKCGEEREAPHVYDNCDDTTCNSCGSVREAVAHSFGDWIADGAEEKRVCSACGHTETRPVNTGSENGGNEGNSGNDDNDDGKEGLSTGAVIGIVAGSVAVLGGGGFGAYWFLIRKKSPLETVVEAAADASVDAPAPEVDNIEND